MKKHQYDIHLKWTGNTGHGTASYTAYGRDYEIQAPGKPVLLGSADPAFLGDPARYNPEELLVAALSACHKLWYLHLCSEAGITVTAYTDEARGQMAETAQGGQFEWVELRPQVTIREADKRELAQALHQQAHEHCFIANSCNFEVRAIPETTVE